MGVKNLWPILAPICERKSLLELYDKAVAIDLSCWVCESTHFENTTQPRMYLRNVFFRTSCLLLLGVKPVFVLEGRAPILKHDTMSQRVQQRKRNGKPSSSSEEENGKMSQHTRVEKNRGSRSRLNSILKQCEDLLTMMGVPCVKSFGEAEALCAQLNEAGLVDGCITQDGDCFLYGAQTVYRNFTISHKGPTCYSVEQYKMSVIEEKLGLSRQKLIALSLLCGCDYNDKGVLGVGKETALKFLEGLEDDEILPRLKQWRTDPRYECLEVEYSTLGNACSKCSHTGKLQKHAKLGCEVCGTKCGCIQTTDRQHLSQKNPEERKHIIAELTMRRKALQDEKFPSQALVDEFLHRQPLPELDLKWKQPDIVSFIKYSTKLLNWTESYAVEKFIPLVTRWQLHNLQNATVTSHQAALPFMPSTIIKKRVLKGVKSFEVKWEDNHGYLSKLEYVEELLVTVEPQEMFRNAYPDVVEEYTKEKEGKPRKGKASRKVAMKTSVKTCSCQFKESGGHYNKQKHICAFVKSSSNCDDVSKIQSSLQRLDIISEVGEGNMKNLSDEHTKHRQLGSQTTKKQPKLKFNYLCSKLAHSTENSAEQVNQKKIKERNLDCGFKQKKDTPTLSTDKERGTHSCDRFLDSEVGVQMLTVKDVEFSNENLPFREPESHGILEEYDCLNSDDEIMDMSSIVENIVCGPSNKNMI